MASRKITDCSDRLMDVWWRALELWEGPAKPFLTCTHRPDSEQDELYAQGRKKPGRIVTKAKAGQSPHNKLPAEAFDICFKNPDGSLNWSSSLFSKFAKIVKSIDPEIVWGGNWKFKDYPHFETPDWKK